MDLKFFVCGHCGNIVELVKDAGVPVVCCGEKMKEIVPGTSDGAVEKHLPVYEVKDGKVYAKVGEAEHPMMEKHYIEWILLQTNQGIQRKHLTPDQKPEAVFAICEDETVEAVYAYCNLHGLWKK